MMNNKVRGDYLMGGDTDWTKLVEAESFLFVFDRMPTKMRIIVDLKMTGTKTEDIAKLLQVTPQTIRTQLDRAKDRILAGEHHRS